MKDILVRTRGLKKYYQVGSQDSKSPGRRRSGSERKGICLDYREIGKRKKHPSAYDRRSGRAQRGTGDRRRNEPGENEQRSPCFIQET